MAETKTLLQTAQEFIPLAQQIYNTEQLSRINRKRFERGEEPISSEAWEKAITTKVQVGLDEKTQRNLMLAAAGVGVLILFFMLRQSK